MMNDSLYTLYREDLETLNRVKLSDCIIDMGYSLAQAIWYYHLTFSAASYLRKLKILLKAFIKRFFSWEYDVDLCENDKQLKFDFLFFRSLAARPDYNEIFFGVLEAVQHKNVLVVDLGKKKSSFHFVLKYLFGYHWVRYFIEMRGYFSISKSLYYALKAAQKEHFVRQFKNVTPKVLVTFADMQPLDNALVQYFQSRGIPTCTLQHGLYIDYNQQDTPDVINYENVVSDFFLGWGQRTANLIKHHHSNCKALILGSPKRYNQSFSEYKDRLLLIMNHSKYETLNTKLLNIAEEIAKYTGVLYDVKLHPYDQGTEHNYSLEHGQFVNTVECRYKLVLGVNSTYLVELALMGLPVLSMSSTEPSLEFPEHSRFSSAEDILMKLERLTDYVIPGDEFIAMTDNQAILNYRAFLCSLIEN